RYHYAEIGYCHFKGVLVRVALFLHGWKWVFVFLGLSRRDNWATVIVRLCGVGPYLAIQ
ncbi:hypothetical protein COCC4DRAFT_140028, partial [Bipolaris maydis ATCC 48331]